MIRVEKLSKKFGSNQVLEAINMNLSGGKVYGVVGENGAGKTTLFRCLAGLEKFEGTISSNYKSLKNEISFLPTDIFLFPKMTGREYLFLFLNAKKIKIENLNVKNIFDLPLDEYATTYSTGMKKKLALTAVLLQENNVLILDEPFNGVDIHSNMVIVEIIKKLKQLGKTIIISSHIFSTLAESSDVIFLLRNGVIEKEVYQNDFEALKNEMKQKIVGDKVDSLIN